MTKITTVDDYLAQFTGETRTRLDTMRELIRAEAPNAVESLSYGLVGYKLNGKRWSTLAASRITSDFTPHQTATRHSRTILRNTNKAKARCSFRLTNPCPLISFAVSHNTDAAPLLCSRATMSQ